MDKKEEYRTPELTRHGTVVELTQSGAYQAPGDTLDYASQPPDFVNP